MTTAPRWFIRRRTLLAFGLGSLGALGACAKGGNPAPSGPSASAPTTKGSALPKPSGNDAVPVRFAKTPSWSSGSISFEIYAVHMHHVRGVAKIVQFMGLEIYMALARVSAKLRACTGVRSPYRRSSAGEWWRMAKSPSVETR